MTSVMNVSLLFGTLQKTASKQKLMEGLESEKPNLHDV